MKTYITAILVSFFVISSFTGAEAKDKVNTKSISKEGFGNVSDIYDQMSPEQKADVYKKAMSVMKELEEKSPEEIEQLKQQMLQMQNSLDFQTINTKKIDTKKDINLDKIQNDIDKYNMQR